MRFLNKSSSAVCDLHHARAVFFSRRRPRQAACGGCPERASELAGEDRAMRFAGAAALVFAAHAAFAQSAPPEAVKELAPTGKLRAAINYGNGVLAQKGPDGTARHLRRSLARTGQAPRRAARVRHLRGRRQGVRGREGQRGRRAVRRDRAGARRRRRILAALCADRRHLHGAEGFAAEEPSPTSTAPACASRSGAARPTISISPAR